MKTRFFFELFCFDSIHAKYTPVKISATTIDLRSFRLLKTLLLNKNGLNSCEIA